MLTYPKIPSVYKRDTKGKIILGEFSLPEFDYLKDTTWVYTEKIDGMNIRVSYNNGLVIRGRTDKATIPGGLQEKIESVFSNIKETNLIFFGEGIGPKIQGNKYQCDFDFILFDVGYLNNINVLRFLDYSSIQDFGVKTTAVLGAGTLQEGIDLVKTKPKTLKQVTIEGIVAKPKIELYNKKDERIIVKIKVKDFN